MDVFFARAAHGSFPYGETPDILGGGAAPRPWFSLTRKLIYYVGARALYWATLIKPPSLIIWEIIGIGGLTDGANCQDANLARRRRGFDSIRMHF